MTPPCIAVIHKRNVCFVENETETTSATLGSKVGVFCRVSIIRIFIRTLGAAVIHNTNTKKLRGTVEHNA